MSVAEIYAGRYVDGTWSYTQALHEAKKRGVSKEEFDAEVFAWRVALGEENRHRQQLGSGWKRTLHDIQRLFLLPTFIFYAHFCFGLCGEKVAKFYSRLKIWLIVHEKFIIFGHLPTFCPLLKSKVGTAYN